MADRTRNRNKPSYEPDENWDQGRDRYWENGYNQSRDLGNINYGREKKFDNKRQYIGNYNQGFGRREDDPYRPNYGYGNEGRYKNMGNNYEDQYNQGNIYESQERDERNDYYGRSGMYGNIESDYRQNRNWRDEEREYRNTGNRNYGAGNMGGYNAGYGGNYNENREDKYRSRYGGDTSNYGNMNQGGMDRDWWDKTRDEVSSWFGDEDAERRRRMDKVMGPHRGKGPKGYQRSDDRIKEDVCEQLSENSFVDASDIDIRVEGAEVILTGTVHSKEEKRRAEDLAESVLGVKNVQNQIRIENISRDSSNNERSRW